MGCACGANGGKKSAYKVPLGKCDGEGLFGRTRCRWKDNIEMYPDWSERACNGFVWFRSGTSGGLLETRYRSSDSIKWGEFVEEGSSHQPLNKDYAP